MARPATSRSIDDILRNAMEPVLKRASEAIARTIADMVAQRLESEIQSEVARSGARGIRDRRASRPSRRRGDIHRWVADRRARRVPKFVIEMTNGLDTKKKIVAKFGADAVFEKGKPAPKAK